MNIYLAAKRRGIYPLLATGTGMNIFNYILKREILQKRMIFTELFLQRSQHFLSQTPRRGIEIFQSVNMSIYVKDWYIFIFVSSSPNTFSFCFKNFHTGRYFIILTEFVPSMEASCNTTSFYVTYQRSAWRFHTPVAGQLNSDSGTFVPGIHSLRLEQLVPSPDVQCLYQFLTRKHLHRAFEGLYCTS